MAYGMTDGSLQLINTAIFTVSAYSLSIYRVGV